ncbi:oxidoreductase [Laceyella putida]|uniref:Oxidoreductase n=1 Tax=Laceyella putida TaxID=110101 RepID=A0ABW2RK39_9BACL
MQPIHVGLIGFGFSGSTFHAPIITQVPGLKLTKVVSSNPDKVKHQLPEAEVVSELEQLWSDPTIELVVITTPNETHFPYAKRALLSGKHVVVEKPFVIDVAEADELIALAEKQNRILSVYHNRRFDSDFLTVKQAIKQGLLGDIYTYEAHYDRYRPEVRNRWREQDVPGAGLLYDLGPHLIDQALQLFGMPQTVYADLLIQRPQAQVNDYFHLILGYESGLRAILHGSCLVKSAGPRYQVHGGLGSLIKHGMDPQEDMLKLGMKPGDPGWGQEDAHFQASIDTTVQGVEIQGTIPTLTGSYETYYQQLAQAIRGLAAIPVPAQEARMVMQIISAALQSANKGTVIKI